MRDLAFRPHAARVLLSLALAAALAGCTEATEPSGPASPVAHDGPVQQAAATMEAQAAALPANRTSAEAFVMDGQTPAGACAFALIAGDCRFTGGDGSQRLLDSNGTPVMVRGTLRWTGTLPGSVGDPFDLEVLVLHEENGNWTFRPGDPYASGPGPLRFELPLTALHGRMALQVSQSVGAPLAVGYAGVMTPHAFHLEGELLSQAPEPPSGTPSGSQPS